MTKTTTCQSAGTKPAPGAPVRRANEKPARSVVHNTVRDAVDPSVQNTAVARVATRFWIPVLMVQGQRPVRSVVTRPVPAAAGRKNKYDLKRPFKR